MLKSLLLLILLLLLTACSTTGCFSSRGYRIYEMTPIITKCKKSSGIFITVGKKKVIGFRIRKNF